MALPLQLCPSQRPYLRAFSSSDSTALDETPELVGAAELGFQGLDGMQVSLVRRPSVWMRNKSPVK